MTNSEKGIIETCKEMLGMNKRTINKEIDDLLEELKDMDTADAKYTTKINNLDKLCEARSREKARFIKPEIIISSIVTLGGMFMIMKFEKIDVITTKAFSFIPKIFKGR